LFEEALGRDPNYPDALAGAAHTYTAEFAFGWRTAGTDYEAKIVGLADRAISLAPHDARAYTAKSVFLRITNRAGDALYVADQGLKINSNSAQLYGARASAKNILSRFEEAKSGAQQAIRLSPRDPQLGLRHATVGDAELGLGNLDAALDNYHRQAELDTAVAQIGENVTGVKTDISKLDDLNRLYETVAKRGKIDVLFAGAAFVEKMMTPEATPEHFDKTFNTNARGTYFTVQKALPYLNDGASIILAAAAGKNKGLPGRSAYRATKAAIRSYARTWTNELKERGIRTNVISPGGRHPNVRRSVPVRRGRSRSLKANHCDDTIGTLGVPR
jgi:NAD(P)-dependent dehydrogenase (short-subunit alcohol dehydrogenase family)